MEFHIFVLNASGTNITTAAWRYAPAIFENNVGIKFTGTLGVLAEPEIC